AADAGVALPESEPAPLASYMRVADGGDLVEYLARFETTLALMQTAPALERIARELAEDAATENVRYMEVRFCPALNTREGLTPDEVLDAALLGLREAEAKHDITTGVIVCGLRSMPVATSLEMAELTA